MEGNNYKKTCSKCNAILERGDKFCKKCGTPVGDKAVEPQSNVTCPYCNAELTPGDKFCMECGKEIKEITSCPKCLAKVKPGNKFCTECGINVYQYQEHLTTSNVESKDEPVDELKKTGEDLMREAEKLGNGIMKEVGGLFNKSSSNKKKIRPQRKGQLFLVCNSCGGYYQLQEGEGPEDFTDECQCGGKLQVSDTKEL